MHDKLYAGFPDLSRKTVMGYAKQLGLDMNRFTSEVDSHKYASRVHSEEQEGEKAGVGGTQPSTSTARNTTAKFDVASITPVIKGELK